jgi:preprotein translocase subunit YajC
MDLVENLKSGDRIITTAGIFGTVMGVQKDRIELKIAANVKVDITKSAVGVILGASDKPEGE